MAARDDAGSGRGGADPGTGATNPGGGSSTLAPTRPAQATVAAVLGSPAFPHPHHHQYYAASPLGQHPAATPGQYPGPSPYQTNFSATPASTRWSSKSTVSRYINIGLRSLATVLSFVAAALIAASSTAPNGNSRLLHDSAFKYLFSVGIIVGSYSAVQSSKEIWEIAFKCNLFLSPKAVDYYTFALDMAFSYLLLSSCSVAVQLRLEKKSIHGKVAPSLAVGSIATSFFAFVSVATSSLFSGYKLCKRIIW